MQMCNNASKRRINGWARVLAAWRQDAEAYPPARLGTAASPLAPLQMV